MRQPVASIMALTDAALSDQSIPPSVRCRLDQVRNQAEWLADLLAHLVAPPGARSADSADDGDAHDLIQLVSQVVQAEMATYPGTLTLRLSGGNITVSRNWIGLRRAISNLVSNATRAAGPAGKVVIELCSIAGRVFLTIDDSGPGFGLIRRGTGLGLRAVARDLESYGGDLEYSRSPIGGVRAILALRAADPEVWRGDAPGH